MKDDAVIAIIITSAVSSVLWLFICLSFSEKSYNEGFYTAIANGTNKYTHESGKQLHETQD